MNQRLRNLNRAKDEFFKLSKKSHKKAKLYKLTDLFIKVVLSVGGGLITYFADPNLFQNNTMAIRIFGIIITSLTAFSSVFMFEKRSLSNIQVYNKCQVIIPELEDKIEAVKNGENTSDNLTEYISKIFKDLSQLNLATFTDSTLEKINSTRNL